MLHVEISLPYDMVPKELLSRQIIIFISLSVSYVTTQPMQERSQKETKLKYHGDWMQISYFISQTKEEYDLIKSGDKSAANIDQKWTYDGDYYFLI